MLVFTQAVFSTTGSVELLVTEVQQSRELRISQRHHGTTITSVTAVGTATGNKFFPPKADASPPAGAGDDFDFDFVDELHRLLEEYHCPFADKKKAPNRGFSVALRSRY